MTLRCSASSCGDSGAKRGRGQGPTEGVLVVMTLGLMASSVRIVDSVEDPRSWNASGMVGGSSRVGGRRSFVWKKSCYSMYLVICGILSRRMNHVPVTHSSPSSHLSRLPTLAHAMRSLTVLLHRRSFESLFCRIS